MGDQPSEYTPQDSDFYEAAFHLMTPTGVIVRYTVHASGANECMKRQEFIIKNRLDGGYSVPAVGSGEGGNKSVSDNPPQSQLCTGFIIVSDIGNNGKEQISVKLPFKLANGEPAKFPKMVFGSAVEMFLKAMSDAGIEAPGGKFIEIPVTVVWRQGKEMPKKNADDPVKHYTDWLSFSFQKPAATKPPVKQPEPQEQTEDIPF